MPKIQMPNIEFNLNVLMNKDAHTGAWVGYIPLLRLYSQAGDEQSLQSVMTETALSFIGLCWHRKILDRVLCERGMRKRNSEQLQKVKKVKGQFIVVGGPVEPDAYQDVPIELLAGKQTQIECQL